MSKTGEAFFTSIGCMDGRVQEPIMRFGQKKFNAKYPDTITEAGLVGQLPKEEENSNLLQSIRRKVFISLEHHHSEGIVVHGHQDCAGNPVADEIHLQDVLKTTKIIRSFAPPGTEVIPVFVFNKNGKWFVKEL